MERSNTYIFVYSILLVVIVAVLLSIAAFSLKDKQEANVKIEKMQNILSSIQVENDAKSAEKLYNSYITESYIINSEGKVVPYILVPNGKDIDTVTAFDIDMKAVYSSPKMQRNLPVFKAVKDNKTFLVIPMRGKGLWGPIWGYLSVADDYNTVFGAVFDHQGETPGLGAEINTSKFEAMFQNKQLFDESSKFVSINVIKGGASPDDKHGVDAISGGTITSNGVRSMIDTCLSGYSNYLQSLKK